MRSLLLILTCSLGLAACGGGDDGGSSGSGSGSGGGNADWAAEVEKICRDNQEATQKVAADVQAEGLSGRQAAAEAIERSTPAAEDLVARLDDIDPPDDVQADYDTFITRIGDALELYPELADTVRANKEDKDLTARFQDLAGQTRPFAQKYGLDDGVTDAG